ncbi:MAG TPA: monovalent cation/H(+) antiporter subunit G [Rugosimonospora sp.]
MRLVFGLVLLAIGVSVSTSGAVGILRMPDVYLRIQSSSKTVTLGALPVLAALVVVEGPLTSYGGRALIVAVLLLVMNPLATHALARAAYSVGIPMWSGAVVDQAAARVPGQGGTGPGGTDSGGSGPAGGGGRGSGPGSEDRGR